MNYHSNVQYFKYVNKRIGSVIVPWDVTVVWGNVIVSIKAVFNLFATFYICNIFNMCNMSKQTFCFLFCFILFVSVLGGKALL